MLYKYIIAALLSFSLSLHTSAQIRANFIETASRPSQAELEAYRASIWESVPAPDGWTNDFEGIFTSDEEKSFCDLISRLEGRTGVEIAVVTVDSNMVSQEKFEEFADHILEAWGVGKKPWDNGMVVCISFDYKKISISRGVGLEKYLSDAMIRNIIAKSFIPYYKKGNFYGGTLSGLMSLVKKIQPDL